jgi:hypothetical protein
MAASPAVRRTALKISLRPTNSIQYDAVTNTYCSRRSDHGVDPCARELAEIADLHPVVANECPKDVRILGETVLSKRRHHTSGIE